LNIFNIALLHYFVLLLVVVERRRRPSSSCCSPASTFSLSLQTLITGRRVFPVRRSAVRFATLKRRLRFNAYFSFLFVCCGIYSCISTNKQQQHTLVSPKCLRNFFSFCLLFVVVVSSVSLFFCLFAHYFRHIFAFSP
jgi:hypothetical protein